MKEQIACKYNDFAKKLDRGQCSLFRIIVNRNLDMLFKQCNKGEKKTCKIALQIGVVKCTFLHL